MLKIFFIVLLVFCAFAYASSPKLLLDVDLKLTKIYEVNSTFAGGSAGLYFDGLYVGAAGYTTLNTVEYNAGNSLELSKLNRLSYAGIDIRYIPPSIGKLFNLSAHCLMGAGIADFADIGNGFFEPVDAKYDYFITIEPQLDLTVNITDYFRLGYGMSYRSVLNSDIELYNDSTFSGFTSNLIAQFGEL